MLTLVLNTVGIMLMAALAVHSIVLHARLRRFRRVLAEVGQMLPTLDASVERMTEVAGDFMQRLRADIDVVDGRMEAAHRVGSELADANRAADAAAERIEISLRQYRQIELARIAMAMPERVEPKGFAEHLGRTVKPAKSNRAKKSPARPTEAPAEDALQAAAA